MVAPIGGNITKVNVAAGEAVAENQVLMVMEAMKMETNVAAPAAGKVKRLHVEAGDSVTQGQVLAEFE
jgi:biotin carboxyl carrier protein